jgi:hypothetical protein
MEHRVVCTAQLTVCIYTEITTIHIFYHEVYVLFFVLNKTYSGPRKTVTCLGDFIASYIRCVTQQPYLT